MIDLLYNVTRKGWLKALSFMLSCAMFAAILMNTGDFARLFGGQVTYLAILVFYGMAVLWIHGIGFDIQSRLWRIIFLPLLGYLIIIPSLVWLLFG